MMFQVMFELGVSAPLHSLLHTCQIIISKSGQPEKGARQINQEYWYPFTRLTMVT